MSLGETTDYYIVKSLHVHKLLAFINVMYVLLAVV